MQYYGLTEPASKGFYMSLTTAERLPAVKPANLVIFLHGLGADGNDLISIGDELRADFPDTAFVSPNAPQQCDMAPFGYQWFSLQSWSPLDMARGATETAPLLDAYIDEQLKRFELDDSKLALVGFSQGTMMALHVGLRRKKQPACIVGFSGALLSDKDFANHAPVCLIHGMADMVVPVAASIQASALLQAADIPVELHQRPFLAHGIDGEGMTIARDFLARAFASC